MGLGGFVLPAQPMLPAASAVIEWTGALEVREGESGQHRASRPSPPACLLRSSHHQVGGEGDCEEDQSRDSGIGVEPGGL